LVTKKKPTTAQPEAATKVTRISASDTKAVSAKKQTPEKTVKAKKTSSRRNPLRATADYFGGAWYELRQVHWPTRRATWSLTGALLGFTAFFVVIILLLDALFKYLFQLVLG
jgi:preprotein translocase subunit SecE